ncbi:hypothetical protein HanRHA438_Chr08g0352101 [Helianthus annuus]|nr:hypothetical protein HanIR_Chr08g0367941 [Helianthus annuus]KAJ0553654.1 hypothetical protein HanHA89_Chr08g0298751 [Helianthus annuus]KAJ0679708.1 hypothetical protein HanOQP8_Chr12g0462701 [Helianthus annuus]KAJ0898020.1 hypothetical protein HanRHA438_Chr08g0352101 [Helianthus annuus]KAJ0901764.1 hypothetical protein HanPSC8_Chr08g0329081 [Helianthus annuus]
MFWLREVVLFALRAFQKKFALLHSRAKHEHCIILLLPKKTASTLLPPPNTLSILSVNT